MKTRLLALTLACASGAALAQSSDAAAEDVAEIRSAPAPEQNALPWYHPTADEVPPPPAPKESSVYSAQLRLFPLAAPAFPIADPPAGGFTLMIQGESRFGKGMLGLVTTGADIGFIFGGGIGGNIGLRLIQQKDFELFLLGPELEAALTLRENPDPDADEPALGFFAGVNPLGLRVVFCPIKVDVRLNVTGDSFVSQLYGPMVGISFDVGYISNN